MGILLIFGLFTVSVVLQGSVLALLGPGGVHPDFLLVTVVALALLSDARRGAVLGFCAGLLQDILFASPVGFFTFGKMLAGLLAGMLAREVYRDFVPVPVAVISIVTVITEIITIMLMHLFYNPTLTLLQYLQHFALPRVAMHFLIMAVIYPYLHRVQKRYLFFEGSE